MRLNRGVMVIFKKHITIFNKKNKSPTKVIWKNLVKAFTLSTLFYRNLSWLQRNTIGKKIDLTLLPFVQGVDAKPQV